MPGEMPGGGAIPRGGWCIGAAIGGAGTEAGALGRLDGIGMGVPSGLMPIGGGAPEPGGAEPGIGVGTPDGPTPPATVFPRRALRSILVFLPSAIGSLVTNGTRDALGPWARTAGGVATWRFDAHSTYTRLALSTRWGRARGSNW